MQFCSNLAAGNAIVIHRSLVLGTLRNTVKFTESCVNSQAKYAVVGTLSFLSGVRFQSKLSLEGCQESRLQMLYEPDVIKLAPGDEA